MPKLLETEDAMAIQIQCLLNNDFPEDSDNLILYLTHHYCLTISQSPIPALLEFF